MGKNLAQLILTGSYWGDGEAVGTRSNVEWCLEKYAELNKNHKYPVVVAVKHNLMLRWFWYRSI